MYRFEFHIAQFRGSVFIKPTYSSPFKTALIDRIFIGNFLNSSLKDCRNSEIQLKE